MRNKNQRKSVPAPDVESRIIALHGEKVPLDSDLAKIYGVPTKALNRAVKRNTDRFPEDFLSNSPAMKSCGAKLAPHSGAMFAIGPLT